MTRGAGPARRSYAEEVFQGCDRAHQSPLGALSACALFPPISAPPAAAPPRLFLLVPLPRELLSGMLHTPGTKGNLVINDNTNLASVKSF